jgi:Cu/Ag efflux pump CusA
VLVNPDKLLKYDVTLGEVEKAVPASNANATGGYLDQGDNELLVRSLGRIQNLEDLGSVVVKGSGERPVLLSDVARVAEAAQVKRGDAAVDGLPAVILTISKQPGADTRKLTTDVIAALDELKPSLPPDLHINTDVYQQKIVHRSEHSQRHRGPARRRHPGRHHSVSLPAQLPHDVHHAYGDPAVDRRDRPRVQVVRHVDQHDDPRRPGRRDRRAGRRRHRRRREHLPPAAREPPRGAAEVGACSVVYEASSEVRNSIVFSTILVVLVFVPLFALGGMEGRLFVPLGVAYIVSIIASLVVSLTVTPVLSYWLLPNAKFMAAREGRPAPARSQTRRRIRHSLQRAPSLADSRGRAVAVALSGLAVTQLGRDFLPPFNEGSVQVNVLLPARHVARNLEPHRRHGRRASDEDATRRQVVLAFARRTGRAELDEHAMGVNVSESSSRSIPSRAATREQILEDIRTNSPTYRAS